MRHRNGFEGILLWKRYSDSVQKRREHELSTWGIFVDHKTFDIVICERHFSLLNRLGTPPKMLRRGPFIRFDSDLTSKVKIGEKNVWFKPANLLKRDALRWLRLLCCCQYIFTHQILVKLWNCLFEIWLTQWLDIASYWANLNSAKSIAIDYSFEICFRQKKLPNVRDKTQISLQRQCICLLSACN